MQGLIYNPMIKYTFSFIISVVQCGLILLSSTLNTEFFLSKNRECRTFTCHRGFLPCDVASFNGVKGLNTSSICH